MSEKKLSRPLQRMFSDVPQRYDLINRIFTLRLDEKWRGIAAAECLKNKPARVLDLCTGTGDLAFRLSAGSSNGSTITGVDFSMAMLDIAGRKAARLGVKVNFIAGDAAELPFREASFDVIGTAFAFRNLTYRNPGRDRYLAEILRVLAPGGRFVIVESSQPHVGIYRAMVHCYTKVAVSFVGGFISGQRGAYRYLAQSAVNFFNPDELAGILLSAGFSRVEHRALLGGVAAIHMAYK